MMPIARDLSIMLLAAAGFVLALIPLALFGGLVYGLWWLQRHENLPSWLKVAQAYVDLGRAYVELAMKVVARPVLLARAVLATVQAWFGSVGNVGGEG